jgi:hypothetical protein
MFFISIASIWFFNILVILSAFIEVLLFIFLIRTTFIVLKKCS